MSSILDIQQQQPQQPQPQHPEHGGHLTTAQQQQSSETEHLKQTMKVSSTFFSSNRNELLTGPREPGGGGRKRS